MREPSPTPSRRDSAPVSPPASNTAISLPLATASQPSVATVPITVPTRSPRPAVGTVAYSASWAEGGWGALFGWKPGAGMFLNDGSNNGNKNWVSAPYEPAADGLVDYAVEVEFQFIKVEPQHPNYCGSFGIVVRSHYQAVAAIDGPGIDCGADGVSERLLLRAIGEEAFGAREFSFDQEWHIYRLEAVGNQLSLYFDDALVLEATDNRYLEPGRVGLWSSLIQVNVRSFKVLAR